MPNIITPNADRRNDTWVLRGVRSTDWRCRIFNRWGRLVYQAENYDNNWDAVGQPDGMYYYELTNGQTGQRLKGTVEVVR